MHSFIKKWPSCELLPFGEFELSGLTWRRSVSWISAMEAPLKVCRKTNVFTRVNGFFRPPCERRLESLWWPCRSETSRYILLSHQSNILYIGSHVLHSSYLPCQYDVQTREISVRARRIKWIHELEPFTCGSKQNRHFQLQRQGYGLICCWLKSITFAEQSDFELLQTVWILIFFCIALGTLVCLPTFENGSLVCTIYWVML